MPFFIGAVFTKKDIDLKASLSYTFSELIKKNTNQKIVEVNSDFWIISAALKKHETSLEKINVLSSKKGILIGRVYPKINDIQNCMLNLEQESHNPESYGKYLSENYWGRYILIANHTEMEISIYRDPQGLSHVYFLQLGSHVLFSSDIHFLVNASKMQIFNYDWEYFASYLSQGPLNTSRTPFHEVSELLPGTCLVYKQGTMRNFPFWDPSSLPLKMASDKNSQKIIPVFTDVVQKLMKEIPNICLLLSGGLDSSSLYLAIEKYRKLGQKHIVINYLDKTIGATDESSYVTELIKDFNSELIFHEPYFTFNPLNVEKWNRPHLNIMRIDDRVRLLEKLGSANIEIINGVGGDALCLAIVSEKFLIDYFIQHGIKGFFKVLQNISTINRSSIWVYLYAVVKGTYKYLLKQENLLTPNFPDKFFLESDLKDLIKTNIFIPPFWDNLSNLRVPPGKVEQILDIYHAPVGIDFESACNVDLCPYLAQPMIELFLSIPTYSSFNGQYSRMHFRNAISSYFNTNCVWRKSKGTGSGIMEFSIRKNLNRILELCLEGKLYQQGLIKKKSLEKYIYSTAYGQSECEWFLSHLLSVELWFEAWSTSM